MRPSRLALAIIAVVAAILLFPFKQTIAPEWTIYTLDADRHPLANITVREVWQQYSLENEGHEEDCLTDSSGRVQFPRRNLRSSISQRLIGCFKQVMMTRVHTSCGAKSYLVAFGKGVDTIRADFSQEQGTTMPWHSTLVLQTQAPVVHQLDEIRKIECKVPKGFGCAILFASVICGVRQLSLIL